MAVVKPDAYQFALEAVLRELKAMREQLERVSRKAARRYRHPELPGLIADEMDDDDELEEWDELEKEVNDEEEED